jgi:hypothetical protein
MKGDVTFALLPLDALRAHEEVVPAKVVGLVVELRRSGIFVDPIWVARDSEVILNGHHRVAALRRLGARRVPAWVIDYESDVVRVERWNPGPAVSKADVLRRAHVGDLFPPQTTRHILATDLPRRPTPLEVLLPPDGQPSAEVPSRRSRGARPSPTRSSPPG